MGASAHLAIRPPGSAEVLGEDVIEDVHIAQPRSIRQRSESVKVEDLEAGLRIVVGHQPIDYILPSVKNSHVECRVAKKVCGVQELPQRRPNRVRTPVLVVLNKRLRSTHPAQEESFGLIRIVIHSPHFLTLKQTFTYLDGPDAGCK